MKQRLGIAAAIMENPKLLILDEPLNALDTDGIEAVRRIITGMKSEERIIILACHDEVELRLMADEIFVVENGHIIDDYCVS